MIDIKDEEIGYRASRDSRRVGACVVVDCEDNKEERSCLLMW